MENSDADILSPNVLPSNAAFKIGSDPENGEPYRPSQYVGGLWFMKKNLIKDIFFEIHDLLGITGAWSLLDQIIIEKDPKIGWLSAVTCQDMGHWSGRHPDHIKTAMFKFMHDSFKEWHEKVFFYLCMEKESIWLNSFGYVYSSNEEFEQDFGIHTMKKISNHL